MAPNENKPIFVLTVFAAAQRHESMASELAHVAYALESAARKARSAGGNKTSGKILGPGAVEIGFWEYLPAAESV